MSTDLYNLKNEKVGTVDLPEDVFGVKWNADLVHQALMAQLANARQNLAHAKGRGEVRGGGKKPWRQKGTGRARHGSTRSPLWIGGGVSHGPTKEEDFSKKINKKMRRVALFSVLSKKLKDGQVKIFDALEVSEPKTKVLNKSIVEFGGKKGKANILLIPNLESKNIFLASENIPSVKSLSPESLNVYDLLNFKNIFIDQKSIEVIKKHYSI